jgi:hypothetical protein
MIIIQSAGAATINPFFPLLTRANRTVRVVPWALYQKTLIPFTIIAGCLCAYGIAMTRAELYSDGRFELLSLATLCFAFVRTMRFRKTSKVYVEPDLALQEISWLADLEFGLCFASFGISCLVVLIHDRADYVSLFFPVAAFCFLFAFVPALNSVTLCLRKTWGSLARRK